MTIEEQLICFCKIITPLHVIHFIILTKLQKLINNSGAKHKDNHKRVVVLYVIKNHVNLHKL